VSPALEASPKPLSMRIMGPSVGALRKVRQLSSGGVKRSLLFVAHVLTTVLHKMSGTMLHVPWLARITPTVERLRLLRGHQMAHRQVVLHPSQEWLDSPARLIDAEPTEAKGEETESGGPLRANFYHQARVRPGGRFPSVSLRQDFVVPSAPGGGELALLGDGVIAHDETSVVQLKYRSRRSVENGIYVGLTYPHNWSHWLLNFLPSVLVATRLPACFDDYKLFLPRNQNWEGPFGDSLKAVWGSRPTQIMDVEEILTEDLVFIDPPFPHGPFARDQLPSAGLRLHKAGMTDFRTYVLAQVTEANEAGPKRIYLRRSSAAHNTLSERDNILVSRLLAKHNFAAVELEKMSFWDAVATINGADAIVGIDGSAFANLIFAKHGAKVLSIFPSIGGKYQLPTYVEDESGRLASRDFYGNVACVAGVIYRVWIQPVVRNLSGRLSVMVNLEDLENTVVRFFGPVANSR